MKYIKIVSDSTFVGAGNWPKVFQTAGCGCCADEDRITQATIQEAIKDAEKWLETLRDLKPENYPEE
jgi:hypothetical protein